jgi:hypothetical protein
MVGVCVGWWCGVFDLVCERNANGEAVCVGGGPELVQRSHLQTNLCRCMRNCLEF